MSHICLRAGIITITMYLIICKMVKYTEEGKMILFFLETDSWHLAAVYFTSVKYALFTMYLGSLCLGIGPAEE